MSAYPEAQYVIDELTDKMNGLGMKLPAPTNVSIINFDEASKITWTDPEDVTINGGIMASWKGTLVVRKEGSAPTSASDGTVVVNSTVKNQYATAPYVDKGLVNGTTYYYGIFPYTEAIIYNYVFTQSFTPSSIEVATPVINSIKDGDKACTIDFTSTATEADVKFVFKAGSAPTSDTDGMVFEHFTSSPANITGLTNYVDYYVAAYNYTAKNVSEQSNVVQVLTGTRIQFAFHYSENDSSPNSITYPEGYDNSSYTDPFYVDLTTGVPHYGDWDKTLDKNKWIFPKMCMLKYDGTRDYYLYEDDVTKKEDGVTASDVANSSYGGNAMVEWGQEGQKLYWKIVPDSDGKGFTFVLANTKADEDMDAWNHYNCKGKLAEHFYTPMYFGSSDGTRLRSISGGTNSVNKNRTAELKLAKANNQTSDEIWNTEVYSDWLLTAMLCMLLSKSTNSQVKFGYGRCKSDNTSAIGQGTMNDKGLFWGSSDQTSGVKVFGMENPWGNLWRAVAGYINDNGTLKIKLTYSINDGSTVVGYNETGDGYITHGSAGTGGYISHMNITNRGLTPATTSGSDNTYYCDYTWFNNKQVNYAIVGGRWGHALLVGSCCVVLAYLASSANTNFGAALSCKPLA